MELVITSRARGTDGPQELGRLLTDVYEHHPGAKLVSHECYADGETAVFNL